MVTNIVIDHNSNRNHGVNKIWLEYYNVQMLKSPKNNYLIVPKQLVPGDDKSKLISRVNRVMELFAAFCLMVETKENHSRVIITV